MNARTILLLILILQTPLLPAQNLKGGGEANPGLLTNRESLESWQSMRFGLFVHWGPVSLRGTEIGWSRGREVPFQEYDQLYTEFNPVLFDADEWVRMMKKAGMEYLIFVTKHHDGFVMWDSETTDYDIMSTPYGRDILRDLSRACNENDILFGTYYSVCDWRHPDYPFEQNRGKRQNANMSAYIDYMKAQLRELVENYGTKILWFDGEWEEPWTHEMGMDLYQYVRSLDPTILINNRVDKGRKGMEGLSASARFAGDFATPEQQVGKFDNVTPWESCITICTQWAWKPNDTLKSREECIQTLVQTAGGDGNLLLNVGPMMDGRIEQRQIDRLAEIGAWLDAYGSTIYGTRGGPFRPGKWGVSTHKDDRIFLHILNQKHNKLELEEFQGEVQSIRLYKTGIEIPYSLNNSILVLELPDGANDVPDQVVEILLK